MLRHGGLCALHKQAVVPTGEVTSQCTAELWENWLYERRTKKSMILPPEKGDCSPHRLAATRSYKQQEAVSPTYIPEATWRVTAIIILLIPVLHISKDCCSWALSFLGPVNLVHLAQTVLLNTRATLELLFISRLYRQGNNLFLGRGGIYHMTLAPKAFWRVWRPARVSSL